MSNIQSPFSLFVAYHFWGRWATSEMLQAAKLLQIRAAEKNRLFLRSGSLLFPEKR